MKRTSIFLILLLALAIPCSAYSQTYFGYAGGGGGGLPFVIDPGTSSGQLLIWDGVKWTPASETTQFYYDATDGFVAFPTSAGNPGFTVMESGATPLDAVTLSGDDTYGYAIVYRNGSIQHALRGNGESVFNDTANSGGDIRMESNNKTYMFFVDAGADSVGINTVLPTGAELVITSTAQAAIRTQYDGSNYADFAVDSSGDLDISPTGTATITNGQVRSVTTVNAATYDLLVSDYILSVTYTATGAVTSLTLPTAQVVAGRIAIVKDAGGNAGTNNITVDTEGAQTIDGVSTYVINSNYQSASLYCDGTNWFAF